MKTTKTTSAIGAALGFAAAFAVVSVLLPPPSETARALGPGAARAPEPRAQAPRADGATLQVPAEADRAAEDPEFSEMERVAEATRETPPPAASTAPLGTVLTGTVTDSAGEALNEAYVSTQTASGDRYLAQTDERGRYTLGALAPGAWIVTGGKRDYHEDEKSLTLVHDEQVLRQDFVLRPKQMIWVRLVTTDGAPGMAALVGSGMHPFRMQLVPVATRADPGATFTEVSGSLNNPFGIGQYWQSGRMRPDRGPEYLGTVTLTEDGPAWLSLVIAHQVLRKEKVDPSTEEVTFVLDPADVRAIQCSLNATIVDAATSEPLAGQVWLNDDPFPMGPKTAVTGDGRVALEGEWPGERWFIVGAEGRAQHLRQVTLTAGDTLELGDIPLRPPITLTGHVRNSDGEPLVAVLRWGRLDPGDNHVSWARQTSTQSTADGSFQIGNLEPAIWVIHSPGLPARPPRGQNERMVSHALRVDATRGPVDDLEIVMRDSTPVTLETEGVTKPWPRAYALDAAGLPADRASPGRYGDETLMHLPPGRFELVVERDGVEVVRETIEVGDEPLRVRLDL